MAVNDKRRELWSTKKNKQTKADMKQNNGQIKEYLGEGKIEK